MPCVASPQVKMKLHILAEKLARYALDNRYLVDLKDVADRHLLYPEEHAQEEDLQLEHLRQRIRAAKEETDLRDGLLQAKFTSLGLHVLLQNKT